jgi:hypothetical protein
MLWSRAAYQLYLQGVFPMAFVTIATGVCLVTLMLVLFAVYPLVAALAVAVGKHEALALGLGAPNFAQWLSWLLGLALRLTAVAVATVVAIFVVRGAYEDRLKAIASLVAIAAVASFICIRFADTKVFGKTDLHASMLAMQGVAAAILAFLLALHFVFAVLARVGRGARLAARAPRFGPRSVLLKYFQPGSQRLADSARIVWRGLWRLLLRGAIVDAAIIAVMIAWFGMAPPSGPTMSWRDIAPCAAASALALAIALRDVVVRPGLRVLNILLAVTLALVLAFVVALQRNDHSLSAADANILRGSFVLPLVVAIRGWFLAPLVDMVERLRRALVRTAAAVVEDSAKPPVLLLRSFADDQVEIDASFASFAFAFGSRRAKRFLEDTIAESLFARGPVIAFADPRAGTLPPLGAARDLVPDDAWQAQVSEQMKKAQLIVCVLGRTPSFRWEIEQVLATGSERKTILVAGPSYPDAATVAQCHPELAARLGLDVAAESGMRGTRVFAYDAKRARWTALKSWRPSERAYADAIRIGAELCRAPG